MTTGTCRIAASAALAMAGLSSAPAVAQSVNLYTSNPVQSIETLTEIARTEAPHLSINAITGGSGVLLRRIEAEAGSVQADLFWSSSANTLGAFSEHFEGYDAPALEFIDSALHFPGNTFLPTNVHVSVIMVNTDMIGDLPMPESWADLADPAYRGQVVIPDPANSSTGYTILWGASQMLDSADYEAFLANLVLAGSSSAVPRGVAMGEYPIGLTFEATAYAYIDGGQEELELVYPPEGTFITPEYLGLVAGAPGGEAARDAVDLMLSQEAQIGLLINGFRRPSRGDIAVSEFLELPDLADIAVFEIDEAEAAAQRETFLAQVQALATGQ